MPHGALRRQRTWLPKVTDWLIDWLADWLYSLMITLEDGADFAEDGEAAGAEVLSEAELEQQQRHADEEDHHNVRDQKRTCATYTVVEFFETIKIISCIVKISIRPNVTSLSTNYKLDRLRC